MTNYIVLYETDNLIMARGIFTDFEKALGHLTMLMKDEDDGWLENGYVLTKNNNFYVLEDNTGYGWAQEWDRKDTKTHVNIHLNIQWRLLECDNDDEEPAEEWINRHCTLI